MFKKIIAYKLKIAAKIILKRKKPEIIAITGSAGKTTTKNLLWELLSADFETLASDDGYNTEIGAPLVLFQEKVPEKIDSIVGWMKILVRCYRKALFAKDFPEKVILEMGADKPGDIRYLSKLFKPEKSIILTVLPVHLAAFRNIEAVAKEKSILATNVKNRGKVYLNIDDSRVREVRVPAKAQRITFGTKGEADFLAKEIKTDLAGLSFELVEGKQIQHINVRLYGEQLIYPLLAAIAVARSEHISYAKIKAILKEVTPTPGRMNLIEGQKESIIVDDSYNANPESVLRALDFLGAQKGRRIALLGNMNELGNYEQEGHEQVGEVVAQKADLLITVGETASKYVAESAKVAGMTKKQVKTFKEAIEAGEYLKGEVGKGDIVLVKGSQNEVRLERAIEKFMAHPEDKEKVLVRQSSFWKNQDQK
jgi:UDP-N-acetylmuramyl pentapeptide synthase